MVTWTRRGSVSIRGLLSGGCARSAVTNGGCRSRRGRNRTAMLRAAPHAVGGGRSRRQSREIDARSSLSDRWRPGIPSCWPSGIRPSTPTLTRTGSLRAAVARPGGGALSAGMNGRPPWGIGLVRAPAARAPAVVRRAGGNAGAPVGREPHLANGRRRVCDLRPPGPRAGRLTPRGPFMQPRR